MANNPLVLKFGAVAIPLAFVSLPTIGWVLHWPALALTVGALVVPVLEWVWRRRTALTSSTVPRFQWGLRWPRVIAVVLLVQSVCLTAVVAPQASGWTVLWLGLSLGYIAGGTGIVLGHELGHRRQRLDKGLSVALLTLVGYGHYQIEHNRGHHRAAATWPDPATARQEENLPQFLLRYYPGVWRSACELSRADGQRWGGLPQAQLLMGVFVGAAVAWWVWGGWSALAVWLIQAAVAQYLVGVVDYVEHWGLQRAVHEGRPERMGPQHIWDCDNPVSDVLLFNLPRHANHHLQPWHNADELHHTPASPQMPTGYAGMVWLASVPPWFKRVMTPRLPTSSVKA